MMKFRGKLAAAIMAGTMAVSMMGISAMADETEAAAATVAKNQIKITKTIKTDGKTYAPNTTFTFTATPTEVGKSAMVGDQPLVKGEVDGIRSVDIKFTPGTLGEDLTGTGNLEVDINKFTKPGIYAYTVAESDVNYPGLSKDTNTYSVYVYIQYDADKKLEVGNVTVTDAANDTAKKNLDFTNDYEKDVHSLTVTKKVDGNQIDHDKTYNFTVAIPSTASAATKAEKFAVYTVKGTEETLVTTALTATQSVKVTLAENESVKVYGLASDEITVTEDDYASDGYKTYVGGTDLTTAPAANANVNQSRVVDETVTTADITKHVLNVKAVNAPTGIVLNYAPYMLIAGLAVVFAVMFLRRREQEEI